MLEALKEAVCEQNHELPANGLVVGSGGNVSGRDPETGLVVIKPSGVKFAKLTPDTMVVVDLVVMGLYTGLAVRLLTWLRTPRQQTALNRVFSGLFAGAAVVLALVRRGPAAA